MNRFVRPKVSVPLFTALVGVSCVLPQGGDCLAQTPLGFNNVVVLQLGDGTNALSTTTAPVSLREFTPSGSPVQTIQIPSGGAGTRLVNVGNSTTEGTLSISPDGRWIAFGGYDTGTGQSSPAGATTASRVAGILNTTTGTYSLVPMGAGLRTSSGAAIRGVATNDGNNIWGIGSSQGLVYGSVLGGTSSFGTISSGLATQFNYISVFSGTSTNLYATTTQSTNPRLGSFGPAALPTGTATSVTTLSGSAPAGTIGAGFVFLDVNPAVPGLDTLYVADSSASSQGGIWKYSLGLSGTWAGAGQISTSVQLRALSGLVSGSNVRLFATTVSTLYTYWDSSAASSTLAGTVADLTTIATASANTAFRGVAVVPEPGALAMCVAGASALIASAIMRCGRRRKLSRQRSGGNKCDAAPC